MMKTPLSVVRIAAFCLPLALVGCGAGDNAPNGGTITSSPSGYAVSVPATGAITVSQSPPFPFTISVKTASGAPVINTAVYVIASQDQMFGTPTQIWITDTSTGTTTGPITITGPYPVYTDVSGAIQIQVSIPLYSDSTYGDTIAFASGNLRVNNTIDVKCAVSPGLTCP